MLQVLMLFLALANGIIWIIWGYLSPVVGAVAFGAVVVLSGLFPEATPQLTVGPISLYPEDLVFGLLFAAACLRLATFRWSRLHWMALGFTAMCLLSFVRGVGPFGIERAAVEFRQYFYFLAGILYFIGHRYDPQTLKRILSVLTVAGVSLVGIAVIRWLALFLGFDTGPIGLPATGDLRVLWAPHAMYLVDLFLVLLVCRLFSRAETVSGPTHLLVFVLPLVVLLLQHRSTWVSLIAGLGYLTFRAPEVRGRLLRSLIRLVGVGALVGFVLLSSQWDVIETSLNRAVLEALNTQESTFVWRIEGWVSLLSGSYLTSFAEYVFGKPFGSMYERVIRGIIVVVSPHNYYLQTFLRVGVVGLGFLLAYYGRMVSEVRRVRMKWSQPYHVGLGSLLVSQLVYFLVYPATNHHAMILGIAGSLLLSSRDQASVFAEANEHLAAWRWKLGNTISRDNYVP